MALPSALSARASSLGRGPTRTYASGSVQICTRARARAPLPLWLAAWTVDAARASYVGDARPYLSLCFWICAAVIHHRNEGSTGNRI